MTDLSVKLLDKAATPALEAFLRTSSQATIFHTLEWHEIIRATYGHKCDYWVAWSGNQIVGAFPVVVVRHPIMGTKMVAMAYQFHSGLPLATDEAVQAELVKHAVARAYKIGAKYLEIRHYEPAPVVERFGFIRLAEISA